MSKILYSQSIEQVKPYPRKDDQPVIGLDPDYLVLEQVETEQPAYDALTQTVTSTYVVDLDNLEYRKEWLIEAIPAPEPTPDWDDFNAAMLVDVNFNTYYGTGLQSAPAITTSIPTALAQVATNGVASFSLTFNGFCQVAGVTPTHRGEWGDLAESHSLPVDFVNVVRGI